MISAIIGAAGSSTRFGTDKMKALLGGLPVLMRTIAAFQIHESIDEIILVVPQGKTQEYTPLQNSFTKISKIVEGGKTRYKSMTKGITAAQGNICLTHNGANPLVTQEEISNVITATKEHGAAYVGRKAVSTLRNLNTSKSVDRENIIEVETPQGFKKELYPQNMSGNFTDEIAVLESQGISAQWVEASPQNRKITTPYDLQIAESFLKPHTRVGFGHDSHAFCHPEPVEGTKNRFITLGGVKIPHSKNFSANSDGDVVIHALCNAIGTAIGEGSLSHYADGMCKQGITDSKEYLKHIYKQMLATGYSIGNIAISIEGKEPKLEKHIPEMKKIIAEILSINPFQIGIACTTGEELTSFGKGEGLQCFVSTQLIKH